MQSRGKGEINSQNNMRIILRHDAANMFSQNLTRRVAQIMNPKIYDQNLQGVANFCEHVLTDFDRIRENLRV